MNEVWCRRIRLDKETGPRVVWHGLMDSVDAFRKARHEPFFIVCIPQCSGADHPFLPPINKTSDLKAKQEGAEACSSEAP